MPILYLFSFKAGPSIMPKILIRLIKCFIEALSLRVKKINFHKNKQINLGWYIKQSNLGLQLEKFV